MFKKFFDFSISGILLTIGLGLYLTGLIIFGLPSVSVFCFFSAFLCFGMSSYLFFAGSYNSAFSEASILILLILSVILGITGVACS